MSVEIYTQLLQYYYLLTAFLWAIYASRKTRQTFGANSQWVLSFIINLILCPVAILWAIILHTGSHEKSQEVNKN
jgi:hypothetical protein